MSDPSIFCKPDLFQSGDDEDDLNVALPAADATSLQQSNEVIPRCFYSGLMFAIVVFFVAYQIQSKLFL